MTSLSRFLKQLDKIEERIKQEAEKALDKELLTLSALSLKECPADTGELRESFKVEVDGATIIKGNAGGNPVSSGQLKLKESSHIILSYNTPYAVLQHEVASFSHPTPGTKHKYLEDPYKQRRNKIIKAIKDSLKEVTK